MMGRGEGFLARIIPATRILQSFTSRGQIKDERIKNAEKIIEEGKEKYKTHLNDFSKSHIKEIKQYLDDIENNRMSDDTINNISSSIANFRSNTTMLGDDRCLKICSIVLSWIESIKKIDSDAEEVLSGYALSIQNILSITNILEEQINAITKEMDSACQRYFKNHPELHLTKNIDNSKVLYVNERHLDFGGDESDIHYLDNSDVEEG